MLRLQRDILMQDVAKLERIRDELEERTGRASSFSRWAEAAGTDERTLQQRLHFGWYCKDSLLKSTRSLVIYPRQKLPRNGIAFDDLIQAGSIGVLRGAERFDPSRGYWKSMLAVVGRYSRGIHIPVPTMEKAIKQVQKARGHCLRLKHRQEAVMRQHMRNDVDKLLETFIRGAAARSGSEAKIAGLAKVRKEEIQRELKHYIHPHFYLNWVGSFFHWFFCVHNSAKRGFFFPT
ncbi:unnamed protein product [Spirodela intermedia]|uniref:RNA polymerase sigma-70 region 2 domain-containing protein n=1 Tax=Spirodela intermedia TaxID=51605 RepID=A0ABN7EC62_SPIIN|nr:unnamed protein product [Spirodela intermedia]